MTRISRNTKDCFELEQPRRDAPPARLEFVLKNDAQGSPVLLAGGIPMTLQQCTQFIVWLERAQRVTSGLKGL